jgi:thioredoxin reductase (NADPH)
MEKEKVLIMGSGPAGLAAALYTARAGLRPVIISGTQPGGQISITYEVQNYIGFPEGSTGPELAQLMQRHAERFGARIVTDEVTEAALEGGPPFRVTTYEQAYEADAVIIATGASPKRLGIPGEEELIGKGVSFCATCDGFFFRDKDVLVVGGGDSALEEGIFLTRFARRVRVVHRRDRLRAGEALRQAASRNGKIEFVWDTVLEEIRGEKKVQSVVTRNRRTRQSEELPVDGVFIFIGHYPNSSLFEGQLAMDEAGYLVTDRRMMTSLPGVFAAGEVQDPLYRQISTSAGQGCAAAMMAGRWLQERE